MRQLLLASIVGILLAAPVHSAPASVAEQTIDVILRAPAAANAVWPGFAMPDRDWLIFDADGAYLVTRGTPPASFVRKGGFYFHEGKLPGLDGTLSLRLAVGDLTVTAVMVSTTVERTASLLYHEAFHAFQHSWPVLQHEATGENPTVPIEFTAALAASIEIERRALRDAIRANPSATALVRQAVSIREVRSRSVSDVFKRAEQFAETREGLAKYVEDHAMALAFGRPKKDAIEAIAAQLATPLRVMAGSPDERLIRTRAYGTGAAIGVVLDRLGVDWKVLAQAESMSTLLAKHVAVSEADVVELAAAAFDKHSYASLHASTDPPWGELVGLTESDFDKLAPFRLVLEVPITVKTAWSLTTSRQGPSGMHRPSPDVLLLPMVHRFTAHGTGLSAVITKRPVRTHWPESAAHTATITVLLNEAPRINGRLVASGTTVDSTDVKIVSDGVVVTMTGLVRIVAEAGRLRIDSTAR